MIPLAEMAEAVLRTPDGRAKTALSRDFAAQWQQARSTGKTPPVGAANPPLHPARPDAPALLSPRDVPRRRPGTPEGRIALLHAVAHIELNAVDLHWDVIARYTHVKMPMGFYDDWVKAADEDSIRRSLASATTKVSFSGSSSRLAGWLQATSVNECFSALYRNSTGTCRLT